MKIRLSLEQKSIKTFIDTVVSKYHFNEKDRDEIASVYGKMQLCIAPYAIYKINQKVTGNKEIDSNQAALVAMTLGADIDKLQEKYEKEGELERAYMLDCLSNELLLNMYSEFNNAYARFHRRYVSKYHFIGTDIKLDKVSELLGDLYRKTINDDTEGGENMIGSNEYGVLTPSKSVIFYALLSDNPTTICEGVCVGCSNLECENRIGKSEIQLGNVYNKNKTHEAVTYSYGYQRIFGS